MESLKKLLTKAFGNSKSILVEDKESTLGEDYSKLVGPPEPGFGPSGDCPKCNGTLFYGFESNRHVCLACWSVFKEDQK